jgi:hypothetical protein
VVKFIQMKTARYGQPDTWYRYSSTWSVNLKLLTGRMLQTAPDTWVAGWLSQDENFHQKIKFFTTIFNAGHDAVKDMMALWRVGLFRGVGRRWLATGVPEPPLARRAQLFSESGAASLWQRLNQLAARPGMINMSQGFPDFEGSAVARRAAARALDDGPVNQYSPQPGYESLRHEVAAFYGRRYGAVIDPASEVLVCASGQEALAGVCVCVCVVCARARMHA